MPPLKSAFKRGLIYIPFDVAVTPRDGTVLTNRWWVVHPEKGFALYAMDRKYAAPQCNDSSEIAESIRDKMYPDHGVRFAEIVFLGHDHDR